MFPWYTRAAMLPQARAAPGAPYLRGKSGGDPVREASRRPSPAQCGPGGGRTPQRAHCGDCRKPRPGRALSAKFCPQVPGLVSSPPPRSPQTQSTGVGPAEGLPPAGGSGERLSLRKPETLQQLPGGRGLQTPGGPWGLIQGALDAPVTGVGFRKAL